MSISSVYTGLADLLVQQLREKGLTLLILTIFSIWMAYKYNQNELAIIKENERLKEENKELRIEYSLNNSREHQEIININKEILMYVKNKNT